MQAADLRSLDFCESKEEKERDRDRERERERERRGEGGREGGREGEYRRLETNVLQILSIHRPSRFEPSLPLPPSSPGLA